MRTTESSLPQLRRDLADSERAIDILEHAQQELGFIIAFDEALRPNPLRRTQLESITARLNSERGRHEWIESAIQKIKN